LGLSLSNRGGGRPTDPVKAHALFDLAARLGSLEGKVYRRELSEEMDPAQIDEALDLARHWRREAVLTSADIPGA
jgi:TPR repeat protein